MGDRILQVILDAKDNMSAVLSKAEGNVQSSAGKMVTAFKLIAAAASALAIGKFLKDSVEEAIRAEQGIARMAQAVTKAGGNFDLLGPQIKDTINALTRLTTFSDDDLMDAFSSLVLRTNDVAGSQKNLALVADIAASGQMDLAGAAEFVAKVMNGQTKGLKAFGIEGLSAADAIDVLTERFSGQALEKTKTFGGQVRLLGNAWDQFKESVGLAIIQGDGATNSMGGLTSILQRLATFVKENEDAIGSFVTVVASLGNVIWQLVKYPLGGLIAGFGVLTGAAGQAVQALGFLIENGAKLLSAIGIEWPEQLGKSMKDAGKAMSDASANGLKALVGIEREGQTERTAIVTTGTGERTQAEQDAQAEIARITDAANAALDETQREATAKQLAEAERRKQLLVGASEAQKEQLVALWKKADKEEEDREKKAEEKRKQAAAERQRQIDATNRVIEQLERESRVRRLQIDEGLTDKQAEEALRRKELLVGATKDQAARLKALWEQQAKDNLVFAAGFDKPIEAVNRLKQTLPPLRMELVAIPTAFKPAEKSAAAVAAEAEAAADKSERLAEQLEKGARGAIGFASGLFGLSDAAANAANNLVSVLSSAKELFGSAFKGDIAGTLTQLIGSAVSLIKGIFGESPEEKARKQLLRDNTSALKALTQATGDLAKVSAPGSEVARIRDFLGGLFGPQGQYTKGSYTAGKMRAGISDADIEKLAGELGITVRNSKSGAIESGALFQLFQALQGLDAGFSNTYAGQLDRLTKGLSLGAITKGQEFGQLLEAIGVGGPNAISRALAGADFASMEGRTSAAGALRGLFTNIGSLKAQDLGGLNQGEFLDALQRLVDILTDPERAIDAIGGAAGAASGLDLSTAFGDLTVSFEDIGTQQIDYLASIDTGISGLLERWTDIETGRIVQAPITITVGEVTVQTAATDAAGTGEAVQAAVTAAINQALADAYLDRQLATGNVTRTVT